MTSVNWNQWKGNCFKARVEKELSTEAEWYHRSNCQIWWLRNRANIILFWRCTVTPTDMIEKCEVETRLEKTWKPIELEVSSTGSHRHLPPGWVTAWFSSWDVLAQTKDTGTRVKRSNSSRSHIPKVWVTWIKKHLLRASLNSDTLCMGLLVRLRLATVDVSGRCENHTVRGKPKCTLRHVVSLLVNGRGQCDCRCHRSCACCGQCTKF